MGDKFELLGFEQIIYWIGLKKDHVISDTVLDYFFCRPSDNKMLKP